jgi:hypothetical protein
MRPNTLLGTLMVVASICVPSAAQADAIVGDLSVTMNYLPRCGITYTACTSLTSATALDFILSSGSTPSPGVAGEEEVTQANGDFAFLETIPSTVGQIKDFAFAGPGSVAFPTAVLAWETIGPLTFDLLTVTVDFVSTNALLLSGTGLFHLAGFDDTAGTFTLTANKSGTTFSASASKGTVPDGGSTAALLGSVLFAFGVLRRRYS